MKLNRFLIDVPERIETRRLLLRSPQRGDGEAVYRAVLESLDELRRFPASMIWAMATPTVDLFESWCREAQSKFLAREDLPFLFLRRDTGDVVGSTGLHGPDWSVPKFEIGFWRRTSARSHGYTTEAVRALADVALSQLGARRLEAFADDENSASCAVCERAGMKLEGILRNERKAPDGSLRNTRVYAITRA